MLKPIKRTRKLRQGNRICSHTSQLHLHSIQNVKLSNCDKETESAVTHHNCAYRLYITVLTQNTKRKVSKRSRKDASHFYLLSIKYTRSTNKVIQNMMCL